jgi:hypothetical protein
MAKIESVKKPFRNIEMDETPKDEKNIKTKDLKSLFKPNNAKFDGNVIQFEWRGKPFQEEIVSFKLREVCVEDLKDALNEVSAKFAYWSNIHAEIVREISDLSKDYNDFFVGEYAAVSRSMEKGATETAKKNQIALDNPQATKDHYILLAGLEFAKNKARVIIDSYEMQSQNLRSLKSILEKEMPDMSGGGNLVNR